MSSKLSSVLYRLSLVLQFLGSWVPNWVIQSQNYYAKQVRKSTYKIHLSAKSSALKNWSPHPYFNILSHLGEWYSSVCIRDKHVAVTGATTPRAANSILSDFGYHSKLSVKGPLKRSNMIQSCWYAPRKWGLKRERFASLRAWSLHAHYTSNRNANALTLLWSIRTFPSHLPSLHNLLPCNDFSVTRLCLLRHHCLF